MPAWKQGTFSPVLRLTSWPWSHPGFDVQTGYGVSSGCYVEYTQGGYVTRLLDPAASSYELHTPLPIKCYSRLYQETWWTRDFPKFGLQGLKLAPEASSSNPLKSVLESRAPPKPNGLLHPFFGRGDALDGVSKKFPDMLKQNGQHILEAYLTKLTWDSAAAEVEEFRLMNDEGRGEATTWSRRFHVEMQGSARSLTEDIQGEMEDLDERGPLTGGIEVEAGITRIMILMSLLELHRTYGACPSDCRTPP